MTKERADEPAKDPALDPERVAQVVERLRAGVRQRQAELATLADHLRGGPPTLMQLRYAQNLKEPIAVSSRPLLGPLLVFLKKVVYHLFIKWCLRSVIQQQNAFNQAAALAVEDLLERHRRLEEEQRRLGESLDELRRELLKGSG